MAAITGTESCETHEKHGELDRPEEDQCTGASVEVQVGEREAGDVQEQHCRRPPVGPSRPALAAQEIHDERERHRTRHD